MARYYFDSSKGETAPEIIDGNPPVDQSALIAQLQEQVAQLQAEHASLTQYAAQLGAKLSTAKIEAQQVLDALA
jgi:uncharacterized protein YlxW (UPF0749 family)